MSENVNDTGYASLSEVRDYLAKLDGERCWNCKFFKKLEEVTKESFGKLMPMYSLEGYCRLKPPVVVQCEAGPDADPEHWGSAWPEVFGEDWCGEYVQGSVTADDFAIESYMPAKLDEQ